MMDMKKLLFILSCFSVCAVASADAVIASCTSSIDAEDLEVAHTFDPSNSLYGLLPGLSVIQTGSSPWDDAASMTVRGMGSFNGNNVLIVIDGVPGRDLSLLNVGEIESIKVLKDAASLALYGNRGADGAIVITTRKGIEDGLKIAVDYNYSLQTPFRIPQMANNYEYASALNEALANDGYAPRYSSANIQAMKNGQMTDIFPNVNWQDEVLR